MTPQVMDFLSRVGDQDSVLEIGSYNVNGTAREAIPHKTWMGVDMREGPNVDMVCDASELPFKDGEFDCVVIAETLEHCENWKAVLSEGWRCLKPNGVMAVTAPAPGFPRHDYPADYWRFTAVDWWGIFNANHIEALGQWESGPTSGIIVVKSGDLNFDIDPLPVPPAGRVIIASALYESKNWSTFTGCIARDVLNLHKAGANVDLNFVDGDSYISRAKNTLCARFLEDPENAVLMMIDWDHWWEPDALTKLLSTPEEIVAADYPMKNQGGAFCALLQSDPETGEKLGRLREGRSPLLKANVVPGGFLRIRRSALEKLRDAYPDDIYHDPSADPNSPNVDRIYNAFFEQSLKTGGEDTNFSRKWTAIGGDLWIEPDIQMGHWWPEFHMGHLDSHLRSLKDMQSAGIDTGALLEMMKAS